MTFPTIPTAGASTLLESSQATATTTHTFPNLTTLAPAAGNLLIAVIVTYQGGSTNAEFSSWGAGFTEFVDQSANSTTIQSIGAAYKFATGSESGTFTVTSVASNRSVMFLMEIIGAHASTVPEATAKANGTSAAANPAALDPAGWDAEDTLWIAVAVNGETSLTGSFTGITAAPTNYGNYDDSGIIGGDVIGALEGAVAFRQLNAASEDVGGFTLDVGAAGNSALLIAVRPTAVTATFDQAGFRGRNDDGDETTATWKAAENTNFSQAVDTPFRLRFVVDETTGAGDIQIFGQLQRNLNAAGWVDVTAASTVAQSVASANVTNGTATTRQLTSGTGTFHAGEFDSNNGIAHLGTTAYGAGEIVESEYSLQILSADVANNDTIQFRVIRTVGGALNAYTQTPTVTVTEGGGAAAPPFDHPIRRQMPLLVR